MNRTNCPNCGAALEWGKPHCAFCGTRIVDLTMLDFDTQEPTAFVLKLPHNYKLEKYEDKNIYLTLMAKPQLNTISVTTSPTTIYGGWGMAPMAIYDNNRDVEIEVSLRSYTPPGSNEILKVHMEDKIC